VHRGEDELRMGEGERAGAEVYGQAVDQARSGDGDGGPSDEASDEEEAS
jgi:hypothetical protein